MKMFSGLHGTLALLLLSLPAAAQDWRGEPDAVMGIKLGAPLSASSMARCSAAEAKVEDPCLEKQGGLDEAPARFIVRRQPFGYADFHVIVDGTGVVSQLMVILPQKQFDDFSAVLVERYGRPTKAETQQWQNRLGATFPSKKLEWNGRRVRILAMERGSSIDRSVVSIQDIVAVDRDMQLERDKLKNSASKL